jgi:TonB-dependent SusC/RagA subfamily outer membrane receptor
MERRPLETFHRFPIRVDATQEDRMVRIPLRHPGGSVLASAPLFLLLGLSACQHSPGVVPVYPTPQDDEVAIAYGTEVRRDMTGSVSSAKREQMGADTQLRVEEMMIGRFPGVDIVNVGGNYSFRIRGQRSILGSNEPLVVVDGVALTDGVSALSTLNPGDIGRIDVLKDAASTSAYGSRGANGVILITMRHGE